MILYNISLSVILLFANWLFVSSYVNINKFFSYDSNNPKKSNILLVNIITFAFLIISYFLANIFFQFQSIKNYDFLPYFFTQLLILWLLCLYGIYLYVFEKLRFYHILIIVSVSMLIISYIYPLLLSIAFDKYE